MLSRLLLLPLLAATAAAQAQTGPAVKTTAADRYIAREMRARKIPGLSLAVIRNGQIVLMKGYGRANVELGASVTPDTVFQTGSVAKQFTAALILSLVEQGTLDLDTRAARYLGDVPDPWKPITVRRLLTHTSGLPTPPYGRGFDLRRDYTEDELLAYLKTLPPDFAPGAEFRYSNTNYILLGILVHKVTGKFYGDLLQERFFAPLGMGRTRVISDDIIMGRASGYQHQNGVLRNQEWVAPTVNTMADHGLYTTIRDMARWEQALSGSRLLQTHSLMQMRTPATLADGKPVGYGFGWALGSLNGHTLVEHAGQWQGFSTAYARYPDDTLSVIVLTNLADANPIEMAHEVAGLYVPALRPVPGAPAKPLADTDPAITALVRDILLAAAKGESNQQRFTPEMQAVAAPQTANVASLLTGFGALQGLDVLERGADGANRRFRYRARYEKARVSVFVAVSADGKVSGMALRPE